MNDDVISTVQFVTVMISVAVAATGLLTLFLSNRRLRAERAFPIVQAVRLRAGGAEIDIRNVGVRTCVDVVVRISTDSVLVAGALQPGGQVSIGTPVVRSLDIMFRDLAGTRRMIRRYIDWDEREPRMAKPVERGWFTRTIERLGLIHGD